MFLPDEDPLGKRIKLGDDLGDASVPWRTIVGVVPDLYLGGAIGTNNPRRQGVYIPLWRSTRRYRCTGCGRCASNTS